jgi:hypothetical protein
LHDWRSHGAFTVSSCTKTRVVLETSGVEIGTALLVDAEYLLDHAAEHQAHIHDAVTLAPWHSPAWAVVTTYYWAFFSVLALTRLTGRTVWFLDRIALTNLRTLAGTTLQPGAGAMYLSVEPYLTATTRAVVLRPSKVQLHEAVWTETQRLISDVFAHSDQNGDAIEYRLWWALKRSGDLLGANWASTLRNAVNYRPGCGYREVIRRGQIDMIRHIRQRTPATLNNLIEAFENEVIAIPKGVAPAEDVKLFSRLLGFYAVVMARITEALHAELLDRQGGDQRWRSLRSEFFADRCRTRSSTIWPLSE